MLGSKEAEKWAIKSRGSAGFFIVTVMLSLPSTSHLNYVEQRTTLPPPCPLLGSSTSLHHCLWMWGGSQPPAGSYGDSVLRHPVPANLPSPCVFSILHPLASVCVPEEVESSLPVRPESPLKSCPLTRPSRGPLTSFSLPVPETLLLEHLSA